MSTLNNNLTQSGMDHSVL
uniref:Uncharacterized protein n=1 Tax=Arundo donax TaxID=35708 RepID=A0A0A9AT57_ARUDO